MLPQALTLVLHFVGGYLIADVTDRMGHSEAGLPVSAAVGVAKEISDLNFNVPDAIMWPLGAAYYRIGKEKGWKWEDMEPKPRYFPE